MTEVPTTQMPDAPLFPLRDLSPRKEIVRAFYKDLWDHADTTLIPQIFHPNFTFRGSLGPVLVGHDQFAGYVALVTEALGTYTSDILDMVEEGAKVFAKVRFHGTHRGTLLGVAATGRHVWWHGAPMFTFDGTKVRDLWVLGDIHGLLGRMHNAH